MKTIFKNIIVLFFVLFIQNQCMSQQWSSFDGIYVPSSVNGSNYFISWKFDRSDRFVIGDFTGNNNDEMLIINSPKAALFRFDWSIHPSTGPQIIKMWETSNRVIGGWTMNASDKYLVGDFNGDGKEELLCISSAGWSTLSYFNASENNFRNIFSNNGSNWIGNWALNAGDKFAVGDFSGRGRDELLCLAQNGWAMLLYFNGSSWVYVWSNSGNNVIGAVNVAGTNSRFVTGKYRQVVKDELLTIVGNWATVIRYNPSRNDWDWTWSQYGASTFGGWGLPLSTQDNIIIGNYDTQNAYDEIHIVRYGVNTSTNPGIVIGVDGNLNFTSYLYRSNSIYFGINLYADRNVFEKIRYGGQDYLFFVKFTGLANNPTTSLYLAKYNNGSVKSIESETTSSFNSEEVIYSLYPNPSDDYINIERDAGEEESVYQIYNMLGAELRGGIFRKGEVRQKVDLSGWPAGTYFIKIQDGNKIITDKIILN